MTRLGPVERLARAVRAVEKRLADLDKRSERAGDFPTWNGIVIERNIARSELRRLVAELAEARRQELVAVEESPEVARID